MPLRDRLGSVAVVAALLLLLGAPAQGAGGSQSTRLKITAPSFVAIDAESGRTLLARDADVRRPIASLTKVMTGLVVIERRQLRKRVRVTPVAVGVEDYREGLVAGKSYRRITLLRSALMVSANDSATALAIDSGGSLERFYELMNARARALGMARTNYASASGLNDVANQSTALDQARLAWFALRNRMFATIVATKRHVTRWAAPTYLKVWINHNRMLASAPGTYGVKTGWTTHARGCLVVAQRRNGRSVIAVLLASKSIWTDMEKLLDAAFAT